MAIRENINFLPVAVGDIFESCKVIDSNVYHYFLTHPKATYYDLILPKYDAEGNNSIEDKRKLTELNNLDLKIGDCIDAICYTIHTDKWGPGVFLKYLRK